MQILVYVPMLTIIIRNNRFRFKVQLNKYYCRIDNLSIIGRCFFIKSLLVKTLTPPDLIVKKIQTIKNNIDQYLGWDTIESSNTKKDIKIQKIVSLITKRRVTRFYE